LNFARSGALALATVLAVMAPTAAQAASYHHTDAAHDVVSANDDNDTVTAAPDRTDGDILTSGVAYGPRRVTLAMKFAALDRPAGLAEHYFSVVTSKGKVRTFILVAPKAHPEGSLIKQTGRGKKFTCKRVHWSIGYGARTVTLSVPTRCLGKPRWVRGAMASIDVDDVQADSPPIFLDDSNTTGFTADSEPKYGPRVHR
jgi:hypothetical protein